MHLRVPKSSRCVTGTLYFDACPGPGRVNVRALGHLMGSLNVEGESESRSKRKAEPTKRWRDRPQGPTHGLHLLGCNHDFCWPGVTRARQASTLCASDWLIIAPGICACSRAQAFQAVEDDQVRSLPIRLRFSELGGAGVPSCRGCSIQQPVEQIVFLGTRGRRRSRLQLVDRIALLGIQGCRRSERWRALKSASGVNEIVILGIRLCRRPKWRRALRSTACRSDHTPRNSRAQAFQAVEGVQVSSLSIRLCFSELEGVGVPSGGGRASSQPVNQIALLGTRGRRHSKRSRALKSTACQ